MEDEQIFLFLETGEGNSFKQNGAFGPNLPRRQMDGLLRQGDNFSNHKHAKPVSTGISIYGSELIRKAHNMTIIPPVHWVPFRDGFSARASSQTVQYGICFFFFFIFFFTLIFSFSYPI
mgnify:CR=1 FL=1